MVTFTRKNWMEASSRKFIFKDYKNDQNVTVNLMQQTATSFSYESQGLALCRRTFSHMNTQASVTMAICEWTKR